MLCQYSLLFPLVYTIHHAIYHSASIKRTLTDLMNGISFHETYINSKYDLEVETIPKATFHCSGVLAYKNLLPVQENKYQNIFVSN